MKVKRYQRLALFVTLTALSVLAGWGTARVLADPALPPADRYVLVQETSTHAVAAHLTTGTPAEVYVPFSTTDDLAFEGDFGPLPLPAATFTPQQEEVTCKQLLLNPALDILELGDGTGRAEPWVIYDPIIYYSTVHYVSPDHSLLVWDADSGDETPTQDAFAQAFYMPRNIITVTIHYYTTMTNTNPVTDSDRALGNLWTLDADGNPDEFLGWWTVFESPDSWVGQTILITGTEALEPMAGQRMVIILFNKTDGQEPWEKIRFDDVTLTACFTGYPYTVYLPIVFRDFGTAAGPICIPPSENPQDQWNANRGHTEADAVCQSTLSKLDQADYYSFTPPWTEDYTLHLRDLPDGTEWSAMIFVDQAEYPPPYAPGPTAGDCRIATTGSGDKSVTCPLTGGTDYFIKVSAGGGYSGPQDDYEMQVASTTGPTPTPTSTPTPSGGIHGQVTYQGSPIPGIYLALRFYNGSSWSTALTTVTQADGTYEFTGASSLTSGQKYYVLYDNGDNGNTKNSNYLAIWGSFDITSYTAGDSVAGGDFDIANIPLASPSHGATVALPYTFQWTRRTATSSDSYEFNLYDPGDYDPWWWTDPSLGYVGSYTLSSLPSGFSTGTEYGWNVWVYAPDGGWGISYYYRTVTFSSGAVGTQGESDQERPSDRLAFESLLKERTPEPTPPPHRIGD